MGNEGIWPVVGPQSSTLEGVKLFMKTVLASKPWVDDPMLVPLPWRDSESYITGPEGHKKLKVGVIWDDGVVKPQPPVLRALKEVVEKLRKIDGVEVVDWEPYRHDYAWELIVSDFSFPHLADFSNYRSINCIARLP
jgi:amidase